MINAYKFNDNNKKGRIKKCKLMHIVICGKCGITKKLGRNKNYYKTI